MVIRIESTHGAELAQVKEQIPEATKVTTTEVDAATAKDITETAKQVSDESKADSEEPKEG